MTQTERCCTDASSSSKALGYDLAQSLFLHQRNLVSEGLTNYWYLESVDVLLGASEDAQLSKKVSLIPANTASKVSYFATILHANKLKVAALLDSDATGDHAAQQEVLVHTLGRKGILRTKEFIAGIAKAEIEDLLRDTLPIIAPDVLGCERFSVPHEPRNSIRVPPGCHAERESAGTSGNARMRGNTGKSTTHRRIRGGNGHKPAPRLSLYSLPYFGFEPRRSPQGFTQVESLFRRCLRCLPEGRLAKVWQSARGRWPSRGVAGRSPRGRTAWWW